MKYYVLVHDSSSSLDDSTAAELFTRVQNAFDSANCHFLQVTSGAEEDTFFTQEPTIYLNFSSEKGGE